MKIRNGFVSNSSSSSFIIADYRKGTAKKDKVKLIIEIDLAKYMDDFDLGELEWLDDEDKKKIKDAIAKGAKIKEIRASNENGDGIEYMLYENGLEEGQLPEGIELLYGDR